MKNRLKKQWVTALRSGAYLQGQCSLNEVTLDSQHRYCCLGVLCDIGIDGYWERSEKEDAYFIADGTVGAPSAGQLAQLGLSDDEAIHFATLNDSGCSFEGIADFIEASL